MDGSSARFPELSRRSAPLPRPEAVKVCLLSSTASSRPSLTVLSPFVTSAHGHCVFAMQDAALPIHHILASCNSQAERRVKLVATASLTLALTIRALTISDWRAFRFAGTSCCSRYQRRAGFGHLSRFWTRPRRSKSDTPFRVIGIRPLHPIPRPGVVQCRMKVRLFLTQRVC